MKAHRLAVILVATLAAACTQSNHFSDSTLVTIADLQDRRLADSLQQFLLHKNAKYRTAAALAFASIQDTVAALQLGNMLLEDPVPEARAAAAFALGQTQCVASSNALIPALQEKDPNVLREVLEALAKTIRKDDLRMLKNFKATDSLSHLGLAWGFYQLGLRGLADSAIAERQAQNLTDNTKAVRLAAAHFFSRGANIKSTRHTDALLIASNDSDVELRMAATVALRKFDSANVIDPLIQRLKTDTDYRVRVAAARALTSFSSPRANQAMLASLNDKNLNVAVAIAESIKPNLALREQIIQLAKGTPHWRLRTNLFKIALELQSSAELENDIQQRYEASSNPYEKAGYLDALSSQPTSLTFIHKQLASPELVVKTAAAQALVSLNQKTPVSMQSEFAQAYRDAILQGDAGVIGIVCSALKDAKLDFKKTITDFSFLHEAQQKLRLPKDIEAWEPLEEAIAFFENRTPQKPTKTFNHPIDWKLVKIIDAKQKVTVATDKGEIILQLLVEEAPGSVANFVTLANEKYFDGKNFHRVVPNFVIQGGCNRGDGFGSEDYSIRSEFGRRRYATGSVGMASAGKDTEGTQWFITHSPTPHLDGRYTIFATVLSGMDVVDAMEVGDKIVSISLIK